MPAGSVGGPARVAATRAGPGLLWAIRIGMTLFLAPLFVIGFGLLIGGAMFGGLGWLGSLFGLPRIAVLSITLVAA